MDLPEPPPGLTHTTSHTSHPIGRGAMRGVSRRGEGPGKGLGMGLEERGRARARTMGARPREGLGEGIGKGLGAYWGWMGNEER